MLKQFSNTSVVKVGHGRGFIIESKRHVAASIVQCHRLIVTAAHCLPHLPPAHAASHIEERTYPNLLGTLNGEANVWAECLFVDPIADIAILGSPDNQALFDEAAAFDSLADEPEPFVIAKPQDGDDGYMLDLDGKWVSTKIRLYPALEVGPTKSGMSGSPILNARKQAIGVITIGTESNGVNQRAAMQAVLVRNLPGWLLLDESA